MNNNNNNNCIIERSCSEIKDISESVLDAGKRCFSSLNLINKWQCEKCLIINTTILNKCFGCDNSFKTNSSTKVTHLVSTTKMSIARCKNCSRYDYSTITPIEQPNSQPTAVTNTNHLLLNKYQLLNYGARKCNCSKTNMISLSSISRYNCVPSTNCDTFLGGKFTIN